MVTFYVDPGNGRDLIRAFGKRDAERLARKIHGEVVKVRPSAVAELDPTDRVFAQPRVIA